ncbi:hypothetical protein Q5752_006039 [Cryptotrichosporon argae]
MSTSASSPPPSTPLKPVTSPSGFTYPAIWSFPPFFTLQPNPATRMHQLELWAALVLGWARHERVFAINADDGAAVFANAAISRELQPAAIRDLLAEMTKSSQASPEPAKQTATYLLYWRKPDEWGQLIYDWVDQNGLTGTIMTFYEIADGELSEKTEFRGISPPMLRRSVDTLVRRGKAQVIRGADEGSEGVRFL